MTETILERINNCRPVSIQTRLVSSVSVKLWKRRIGELKNSKNINYINYTITHLGEEYSLYHICVPIVFQNLLHKLFLCAVLTISNMELLNKMFISGLFFKNCYMNYTNWKSSNTLAEQRGHFQTYKEWVLKEPSHIICEWNMCWIEWSNSPQISTELGDLKHSLHKYAQLYLS